MTTASFVPAAWGAHEKESSRLRVQRFIDSFQAFAHVLLKLSSLCTGIAVIIGALMLGFVVQGFGP